MGSPPLTPSLGPVYLTPAAHQAQAQGWGNSLQGWPGGVSGGPQDRKMRGCKAVFVSFPLHPHHPHCLSQAGISLGMRQEMPSLHKVVLPSTPVLRDPYKDILSSGAGQQGWAPDNLLEKSSLLAPPIPHHPPHSWSLPIEGAPESPSRVRYTALKNTLHSRSALASSGLPHLPLWGLHTPVNTASDPICSVHCCGSPAPHTSARQTASSSCHHVLMLFPTSWPLPVLSWLPGRPS